MKKIKSIKQLQSEKKRIKQHQEELEDKLRGNWAAVKESLRPKNIAKDAISSIFKKKTEEQLDDENVLKSSFTYGVSILAKRFADKAGQKLGSLFKDNGLYIYDLKPGSGNALNHTSTGERNRGEVNFRCYSLIPAVKEDKID